MADDSPTAANETASERGPTRLLELVRGLARELRPGGDDLRVAMDSHLDRDLGFDSLGRTELMLRVERAFSAKLSETLLVAAETPADIWRALQRATPGSARAPGAEAAPALGTVAALPTGAQTLTEVLQWHVAHHPARTHVWLADGRGDAEVLDYAALDGRARAVAEGILEAGLRPGARVALMLPTGADFLHAFYGILHAGCIPVPIYPPARPSQLEDHLRRQAAILADAGAELMVTVPEARKLALFLRAKVASLGGVETVADLSRAGIGAATIGRRGDDIALLQYTSGSTGEPKGVALSHANLLANIRAMGQAMDADSNRDVFVSWLPLYHDMGLIGAWLGCLYFAVPVSILSPLSFLARPESWLWEIHRRRATLSGAPNFAFDLCTHRIDERDIEGLDLSSARMVVNGAEPVRSETVRAFCRRFARYGFDARALAPVYGLAESGVGLAFPPPGRGLVTDRIDRAALAERSQAVPVAADHEDASEFAACGLPLPGHQFRVVDETGREAAERRQGRLQFAGPSSTRGYHGNRRKTAELFDGDWLETGDLAYIVAGDVYLTGRIKDVVIRAGRNIHPHEVEGAVGELDGVRRGCVAAFAAPAPDRSERLVVVAETREGDAARRARMTQAIQAVVLDVAGVAPDEVVLAPPRAVLKTSSGKIRRAATAERYLRGGLDEAGRHLWWQIARLGLAGAGAGVRGAGRTLSDFAFAGWWWGTLVLLAGPVWGLAMVLPRQRWRWSLLRLACRAMLALTGARLVVEGGPARRRGVLLVANHCSYLDSLVLVAALPGKIDFVAKAELDSQFFAGTFLRRIGTLFVERFETAHGVEDVATAAEAARRGRRLLVYPEGTLTRRPGLLAFKLGAFAAAAAAGATVVPVTVRGTRSILRGGQWFPRRGEVGVAVGEEIVPEGRGFDAAVALRDRARAAILARCGEPDLVGEDSLLRDRRRKAPGRSTRRPAAG
ncbi:MAG: AMP-binding protein [Alphaproteobacteria bacterium]|nr:AMP-binding protein [Alphaproteobacteria bacterium]